MELTDCYKLPFRNTSIGILDNDYNKVGDWLGGFMSLMIPNSKELSEIDRQHVVDCLNNQYIIKGNHTFNYDKDRQLIICDNFSILRIRGWGHLIGTGGCNLSPERAFEIQNELGEFIVKQLSKKQ